MLTRRSFAAAVSCTLATGALAHDVPVLDIAGSYDARGMNRKGGTYIGVVEVNQQGTAIAMAWAVGTETYQGIGQLDGRVLTVDWGGAAPIVYVVMGDRLHGTWDDGLALERLIRR